MLLACTTPPGGRLVVRNESQKIYELKIAKYDLDSIFQDRCHEIVHSIRIDDSMDFFVKGSQRKKQKYYEIGTDIF